MSEDAPQEAVVEIAQEARSSIELSRDAKSVYRWNIKAYGESDEFDLLIERIKEADETLRQWFSPDYRLEPPT